ncbi:MAG: D-alanyl-D-alanine carboxypeptidase family protein [Leptospirillia bacterium]
MAIWMLAFAAIPGVSQAALTAKSMVVMDAVSGQIVKSEKGTDPVGPASLAKMMTLYLTFTAVSDGQVAWDDPVLISNKAWGMGGSKMFIREGTRIPLKRLVTGIAVVSGNDASIAVAEHLSGSEEGFVAWMNEVAGELGLTGTRFGTATGFPAPGQVTNAEDMARLGRALITDFPESIELLSTKKFTHEGITQNNRNRLLFRDIGVDGIKTGHTEDSGFHLVASAKKDDQRFIVAVMGADSEAARETIAQRYLMAAFRTWATVSPLDLEQPVAVAKVWKGGEDSVAAVPEKAAYFTVKRKAEAEISVTAEVEEAVAPIEKGQVLGVAHVMLGEEELATVNLVAAQAVEEAGLITRFWHSIVLSFHSMLDTLF